MPGQYPITWFPSQHQPDRIVGFRWAILAGRFGTYADGSPKVREFASEEVTVMVRADRDVLALVGYDNDDQGRPDPAKPRRRLVTRSIYANAVEIEGIPGRWSHLRTTRPLLDPGRKEPAHAADGRRIGDSYRPDETVNPAGRENAPQNPAIVEFLPDFDAYVTAREERPAHRIWSPLDDETADEQRARWIRAGVDAGTRPDPDDPTVLARAAADRRAAAENLYARHVAQHGQNAYDRDQFATMYPQVGLDPTED